MGFTSCFVRSKFHALETASLDFDTSILMQDAVSIQANEAFFSYCQSGRELGHGSTRIGSIRSRKAGHNMKHNYSQSPEEQGITSRKARVV